MSDVPPLINDDLPPTQPMCAKHWWTTLGPDGRCPVCAGQAARP